MYNDQQCHSTRHIHFASLLTNNPIQNYFQAMITVTEHVLRMSISETSGTLHRSSLWRRILQKKKVLKVLLTGIACQVPSPNMYHVAMCGNIVQRLWKL